MKNVMLSTLSREKEVLAGTVLRASPILKWITLHFLAFLKCPGMNNRSQCRHTTILYLQSNDIKNCILTTVKLVLIEYSPNTSRL